MLYALRVAETHIHPGDWDQAVADVDGPQLVVAGPGTGKTEFLVRRAAHLIDSLDVSPVRLLLLTFSRRGAADLRRRVDDRIRRSTTGIPASTFHSFAFRLLELHAPTALGWESMPSILTGPEQVAAVAELLATEQTSRWPAPFRPMLATRTFAEEVADFIMRSQERLVSPDQIAARSTERADWRALPDFIRRYQAHLRDCGRIDYGTLQAQAVRLLSDLTIRAEIAEQYHYVLVDEYQDTTIAQAALLDGLTAVRRNLTVAADPDQSVYSFRGAEIANVSEFPGTFRDLAGRPARRIVLATSFRVPREILAAASAVRSAPAPGAASTIGPAPHAGRVEVRVFDQLSHEAEWIADEVQRIHLEEGLPLDDIAVLVRTKRRILPELSRALDRRHIPHDKPDTRLVDHPAVRLIFDIVALATGDPLEMDPAASRLLLGPLFEISISRQRDLLRARLRSERFWPDIFRADVPGGAPLALLLTNREWATRLPAAQGFWHAWTTLPQFVSLARDPAYRDARAAWTSLSQALVRLWERDPGTTLAAYAAIADADDFEATPMLSYRAAPERRLTLTTLHQSKGLEFDVVFIADAVEGTFPDLRRRRSMLQTEHLSDRPVDDARAAQLSEEMRLAFTAMTRSRRRVTWTATDAGIDEGEARPSRFLDIIAPIAHVDPSDGRQRPPVTIVEAESRLRATLADAAAPAASRLAAAATLAGGHPGLGDPRTFANMRRPGPSTGVIDRPIRLSPTQAESYERCPRQYVLERRLRIGHDPNVYMAFGSLIHDVLEAAEQQVLTGGAPSTLDDALEHLQAKFDDYDFGPGAWRLAWYRRAQRCLETLYANWPRPDDRAVLLEHELFLDLAGMEWRGIADRIETSGDGRLRVVDYKTTTRPPPIAEANVSLQLGFYLLAARSDPEVLEYGVPAEAEYWYPMKSAAPGKPVPLDLERIDEVEARLIGISQALESEDWTPRPNSRCPQCAVRILCPEWPEGRDAFVR